jgi:methyl-accepting chemotaxis protein
MCRVYTLHSLYYATLRGKTRMDNQTLLIVFVGLTGAAVLLQACVLLGIFLSLRKAAKSVTDVTDDLKGTVIPLVHTSRNLMERISPQVLTISTGLAELIELIQKESSGAKASVSEIKASVTEIQASVHDIVERVSRQTARLDSMLTVGLDTVERAATTLETSVAAPVRQANGIIAAIKATIETYRTWPRSRPVSSPPVQPVYPDPDRDVIS